MARRRELSCNDVLASLDVLSDICTRLNDKKTKFICNEGNNFVCEEHRKWLCNQWQELMLNIQIMILYVK